MSERRGRRKVRAGEEESVRGAGHPDPSQLLQSLTRFPLNLKFNSCNFFINTACTPPITFDPHQARRPSRSRTPTRSYSPYHRNRLSSRSSSERNWSRRRSRSNSHYHRRRHRSNSHHRRMRRSPSSSYSSYSDSRSSDIVREQPIIYPRSPSPYRSLVRDDSLDEHYSRSPNHSVSRSMSPLKARRSRSRTPVGNHLHSPERSPSPTWRTQIICGTSRSMSRSTLYTSSSFWVKFSCYFLSGYENSLHCRDIIDFS